MIQTTSSPLGFTNPVIITVLAVRQHSGLVKPSGLEVVCIIFTLLSLGLWLSVYDNIELVQYALYLAIIADLFALIPTLKFVWAEPNEDRPFAWILFGFGYGLAIFAITDDTFANYALPVWMFFAPLFVAFPLVLHRLRYNVPLSQWI